MKIKLLIIVLGVFFIQFISSCCRENLRFYDYTKMTAQLSDNFIASNESLTLRLIPSDLEYLSYNSINLGFTSAFAVSCEYGFDGMKFPFNKLEITSSSDFDDQHFADDDLASLFLWRKISEVGELELVEISNIRNEVFPGEFEAIEFVLNKRPTLDLKHKFKIKLTKSNGEEINIETEEVEWR